MYLPIAEIDLLGAIEGTDFFLTLRVILVIIYFLWIFAWAKKQVGPKIAVVLTIVLVYLLFFNYPDLIWVPFLLFLWSIFGKDLLERIPRSR